jgi:short-subunit dehydrogenase
MNIHSSQDKQTHRNRREPMSTTTQTKTILITGATSGIGRDAALHLARRGYRVFATGRREDVLAQLRRDADGLPLETIQLDVTDATSIAACKRAVDARTNGRGIDVLVNNAGYGTAAPTELLTDEDLRAMFETNVFGLMAVTRAFLPQMRERGEGRVINVSSIGGRFTFPFFGGYNGTKYAVESLSDALRMELRAFGVKVVLVEPGLIATNFSERSMTELSKYRKMDSPYTTVFERAEEIRQQSDRRAVPPIHISRAIEKAIRARRPRARYVAPFSAKLLLGLVAILPTRWMDAIVVKALGLDRRSLGLGAAKAPSSPQLRA